MAITGRADIFPRQRLQWIKSGLGSTAFNALWSLWSSASVPAAGSLSIGNTTTGVVPTDATTGAPSIVDAGAGRALYLCEMRGWRVSQRDLTAFLYDRLWHGGSFNANQAIGTPFNTASPAALTRPDANGENTEIWLEVNTAISATATNVSVRYTNSAGTTGKASPAVLINGLQQARFVHVPFASGDVGVRAIEGFDTTGTVASSGSFNIVIIRRLAMWSSSDQTTTLPTWPNVFSAARLGLPRIYNDSCLAWFVYATASSTGEVDAEIAMAEA